MAEVIRIETIAELENLLNGGEGYGSDTSPLQVVLSNDLDFSELDDTDRRKFQFNGSNQDTATWYLDFDGRGHSIKNMCYSGSAMWCLFGSVYGSIRNITLSDLSVTSGSSCYGFCYELYGTMFQCHVRGNMIGAEVCGVTHLADVATIDCCSFIGNLTGSRTICGIGISNAANSTGVMSRCYVIGNIRYTNTSNSVIRLIGSNSYIQNCFFRGNFYSNQTGTSWTNVGALTCKTLSKPCYCYVILENVAELKAAGISLGSSFWNETPTHCYHNHYKYTVDGTEYIYEYSSDGYGEDDSNLESESWWRAKGMAI